MSFFLIYRCNFSWLANWKRKLIRLIPLLWVTSKKVLKGWAFFYMLKFHNLPVFLSDSSLSWVTLEQTTIWWHLRSDEDATSCVAIICIYIVQSDYSWQMTSTFLIQSSAYSLDGRLEAWKYYCCRANSLMYIVMPSSCSHQSSLNAFLLYCFEFHIEHWLQIRPRLYRLQNVIITQLMHNFCFLREIQCLVIAERRRMCALDASMRNMRTCSG